MPRRSVVVTLHICVFNSERSNRTSWCESFYFLKQNFLNILIELIWMFCFAAPLCTVTKKIVEVCLKALYHKKIETLENSS